MQQSEKTIYNIRVATRFLLTPQDIKQRLGIGFQVLSVDAKETLPNLPQKLDTSSMVQAIVSTGFKRLARLAHPDVSGDPNAMVALNKAKQELTDLLRQLGIKV